MKKFLFVLCDAPHSGTQLQEILDVILTTAAFDQSVGLLFLDAGVFQLKQGQQPEKQVLKQTANIFDAFDLYDINHLYVETESLQQYGLQLSDLSLAVKCIDRQDVNQLIQQYEIIF